MSGRQNACRHTSPHTVLKDDCLKQMDVSDESQVKDLVAKAASWGGRLDIWVNNAAKFVFGEATMATDAGKFGTNRHHVL